jgi:carbon storage regulator CsrA
MLVLSRRHNEKILLPTIGTTIEVLDIKGDRVRLGIDAPSDVTILREELAARQGYSPAAAKAAADVAAALARQQRHQLRNQLNAATIGVALARRQLQAGLVEQVAATLTKIGDGVQQLNQQMEAMSTAHKPAKALARPKALLVEDDHNECELLAGFFRLAGYQVATAGDGADALDYLEHHEQPDLMLLDMMLPRCDGATTIRRVRDNPEYSNLKIYAMSGYTPDQLGLDCHTSGVARWFQKPLNPELLLKELDAAWRAPICA